METDGTMKTFICLAAALMVGAILAGCGNGGTALIIDHAQPVYFGKPVHLDRVRSADYRIDSLGIVEAEFSAQVLHDFFRYGYDEYDINTPSVYIEDKLTIPLDSLLYNGENRFISDARITVRTWEGLHPLRMVFWILSSLADSFMTSEDEDDSEMSGFDSEEKLMIRGFVRTIRAGGDDHAP
jgi:hypothetical protein